MTLWWLTSMSLPMNWSITPKSCRANNVAPSSQVAAHPVASPPLRHQGFHFVVTLYRCAGAVMFQPGAQQVGQFGEWDVYLNPAADKMLVTRAIALPFTPLTDTDILKARPWPKCFEVTLCPPSTRITSSRLPTPAPPSPPRAHDADSASCKTVQSNDPAEPARCRGRCLRFTRSIASDRPRGRHRGDKSRHGRCQ